MSLNEPNTPNPYAPPADIDEIVSAEVVGAAVTSGPWGFWATAGLGAIVAVVFLTLQTAVAVFFVVAEMANNPGVNQGRLAEQLETNGLLLALATCLTTTVGTPLVFFLAKIRRGISVQDYLGLRPVSLIGWIVSIAAMLVMMAASDGVTYLLGKPIVPEFMVDVYRSAGFTPLLWLAIVVAAPLFEFTLPLLGHLRDFPH